MNDKLLECPFCGGEAEICESEMYRDEDAVVRIEWMVECANCHAAAPYVYHGTRDQAIAAWNRRAGDTQEGKE